MSKCEANKFREIPPLKSPVDMKNSRRLCIMGLSEVKAMEEKCEVMTKQKLGVYQIG